jgi:CRISPR-associated protein Cmr1
MMPSTADRDDVASTVITISAWYEVVTPLFCAGARREDVGVRPASLRGVLRWWWRATRYGVHHVRCNGDPRKALGKLAEEEKKLFGSSETGRGRVALRVEQAELTVLSPQVLLQTSERNGASVVGPGARYLGYGLVKAARTKDGKQAGQLVRSCGRADPGTSVRVDLVCRRLDEAELQTLEIALDAFGLLGGLGARSRRGWGSLALRSRSRKEGWPPAATGEADPPRELPSFKALCDRLSTFLGAVNAPDPPYPPISAFGSTSRVVVVPHAGGPLDALDAVGQEFIELMREQRTDPPTTHPRRAVFGLPRVYGNGEHQRVEPAMSSNGRHLDRRASPLLLHVHRLKDPRSRYQSAVVCTALPAEFLPRGARLKVRGGEVDLRPPKELYEPVHAFLDHLVDRLAGTEVKASDAEGQRS